ncbi:hypothetical protein [Commensalibacter intestini]|uniref:hypothetical protein n=1 Tax=Commensalibacter intestini TaxID=479936 RepID=UPI000303CA03|nr:hypothetical protein [Commensalibacter intestini]
MKLLNIAESKMVAGGHNNNHSNNNNNHNNNNNNHNNNNNNAIDATAKANIIGQGLASGQSWAQIGQNIGSYFQNKYAQ